MKTTPNFTNQIKRRTEETEPLNWIDVDNNFQYGNYWTTGKTYKQGMKIMWNDYLGVPYNSTGQMSEWVCTSDHVSNLSNSPGAVGSYWERLTYMGDTTTAYVSFTLGATGWTGNSQTVTVNGVTSSNFVSIGAPINRTQYIMYGISGISCTAQGTNSLTFVCDSTPNIDIIINVKIES